MSSIDHATRFFLRGNQLLARADFPHAIPEFTRAIQARPDYYEAYHNRALARYWQNDFVG
jgi:tetratricopeptide (TPR) repeat protein